MDTRPDGSIHAPKKPWEIAKQEAEIAESTRLRDESLGLRPVRHGSGRVPLYPGRPIASRRTQTEIPPDKNSATREFIADKPLTVEIIGREVSKAIQAGNFSLEILINGTQNQSILLSNGFTLAGTVQRNIDGQSVTYLRFRTMCQGSGDGCPNVSLPR
jgi:hypothetical protein